jgi:hypothetical protein
MNDRIKYAYQDPNDDMHDMMNWIIDNPPDQWCKENGFAATEQDDQSHDHVPKFAATESVPVGKPLPERWNWDRILEERAKPPPPEILAGLLHQGCRMSVEGSSKAGKTWSLINLALCVASGQPWLGVETFRCKVLYMDFELKPWFGTFRLTEVGKALPVPLERADNLVYWPLRGSCYDFDVLLSDLVISGESQDYGLIIVDPYYKAAAGIDENSAGDVLQILSKIEQFSEKTGAAFVYAHHFSKGNKADVDAMDRASGSGVFSRDPDSKVMLTNHQEEDCLTMEAKQRNCAPLENRVVEWDFPAFKIRDDLDPDDLLTISASKMKKAQETNIFDLLPVIGEILRSNWEEIAREKGIKPKTFQRQLTQLVDDEKITSRELPGKGSPKMFRRAQII